MEELIENLKELKALNKKHVDSSLKLGFGDCKLQALTEIQRLRNPQELLLMCGEMSAADMWGGQAVLSYLVRKIGDMELEETSDVS